MSCFSKVYLIENFYYIGVVEVIFMSYIVTNFVKKVNLFNVRPAVWLWYFGVAGDRPTKGRDFCALESHKG